MIKSKVTASVKKAFDGKLKDAVTQFKLMSRQLDGDFIPCTSRGVFEYYSTEEIAKSQGAIVSSDQKITLLQDEIKTKPKQADLIKTLHDEYRVVNISDDPTHSIWQLQARG